MKPLWIPQIREYQMERINEGAPPGTMNKEVATLWQPFQILVELRHAHVNPAHSVKRLSEKSGKRQVYISHEDFLKILDFLPVWFHSIAQTACFSRMSPREVVGLTCKRVNLRKRVIYLGPDAVKEGQWKRVPIHKALGTDHIFLHNGEPVTHRDQLGWCGDRQATKVELDPHPCSHDLRHTWKTNARRSGMHPEIQESILGHTTRTGSVSERYGRISDKEFLHTSAIRLIGTRNSGT